MTRRNWMVSGVVLLSVLAAFLVWYNSWERQFARAALAAAQESQPEKTILISSDQDWFKLLERSERSRLGLLPLAGGAPLLGWRCSPRGIAGTCLRVQAPDLQATFFYATEMKKRRSYFATRSSGHELVVRWVQGRAVALAAPEGQDPQRLAALWPMLSEELRSPPREHGGRGYR